MSAGARRNSLSPRLNARLRPSRPLRLRTGVAQDCEPAYVFVGDEAFFRKRCRDAILEHLVPPTCATSASSNSISPKPSDRSSRPRAHALADGAVPGVLRARREELYSAAARTKRKSAPSKTTARIPNPDALLVFVADHISIPADARRMEMTDKDRYQSIRETWASTAASSNWRAWRKAKPSAGSASTAPAASVKIDADGARELVDALGGDMMMVSNELEKLILYVGEKKSITLGDVETMVLAAKQRSLYELTDAISAKDRVRALEVLDAMLSTGDGEEAAIGHLYMLAKTFRQMLVILERNVRDQRMLWAALWQGFRVPPFAADDIIRQARRYKSRRELTRAIRLVAKADLALRSNPASKRLILERLVLDLTAEPKLETPGDGCRNSCRCRNAVVGR